MFIYSVAKNGLVPVQKNRVVKETPKTYILDTIVDKRVLKSTMSNNYVCFFTDEKEAKAYYKRRREYIERKVNGYG